MSSRDVAPYDGNAARGLVKTLLVAALALTPLAVVGMNALRGGVAGRKGAHIDRYCGKPVERMTEEQRKLCALAFYRRGCGPGHDGPCCCGAERVEAWLSAHDVEVPPVHVEDVPQGVCVPEDGEARRGAP